jgi:branched-chain amino acid transport system permease protein
MAHAALMGMGAYTAAILTTDHSWPFPLAIAAGALVGAIVGTFLASVTIKMSELVLSLATLGFGETVTVIAFNAPLTGGAKGFTGVPLLTTPPIVLIGLLLVIYIVWRYDGSRVGLAARAVRDNPLAAAAMGIDVLRVRMLTYGLGGALAAAAGTLAAHYATVVSPDDLRFFLSLGFLLYVVFGGSYSMWGPLVGAGVLTTLPQVLRFSREYRFILYGLLILFVILLRPQGLITRVPTGRRPRFLGGDRAPSATPPAEVGATSDLAGSVPAGQRHPAKE